MSEATLESTHSDTPAPTAPARAAAGSAASADSPPAHPAHVTIIEARSGWRLIDWRELAEYRDMFTFLVWRGIKVRYAQSAIGIGWAIIQPLFSAILFTVIFGNLAKISSDGVPYILFSMAALVPWTFFSGSLNGASTSLVSNANMISKVYFPRMILPMAAVLSKLLDFAIGFVLLLFIMAWVRWGPAAAESVAWGPTAGVLMLPFLVFLMMLTAAGLGMWSAALAIQYRDVKHAMTFVVQMLMYAAPVIYAVSEIPEQYRLAYAVYPMVGVIEGFRSALLGTVPMPWDMLAVGTISAVLIALSGCLYFRRRERLFADVA